MLTVFVLSPCSFDDKEVIALFHCTGSYMTYIIKMEEKAPGMRECPQIKIIY